MLNAHTLVQQLYEQSCWTPGGPSSADPPPMEGGASQHVVLPAPCESWILARALERRTATYAWGDDGIPAAALHAVLRAARAGAGVELRLIVWRVEGVPAATYRWEAQQGVLVPLGPAPDPAREGRRLLLQAEFASAAALLFAVGDLAGAVASEGPAGHRRLLMRGGGALQRMWLAAAGSGLAGCIFAAFHRRVVQPHLHVDGLTRVALAALAVGSAREDP
ncbi:MAG: nitroreductase family protein [Gemmatimonadetes bacterium]|nr:nitroreductase family protein [Gemmatimonadota bacterium]